MKFDLYHSEIWLQFSFLLEHNDDCDFKKLMNATETNQPEQEEEVIHTDNDLKLKLLVLILK